MKRARLSKTIDSGQKTARKRLKKFLHSILRKIMDIQVSNEIEFNLHASLGTSLINGKDGVLHFFSVNVQPECNLINSVHSLLILPCLEPKRFFRTKLRVFLLPSKLFVESPSCAHRTWSADMPFFY